MNSRYILKIPEVYLGYFNEVHLQNIELEVFRNYSSRFKLIAYIFEFEGFRSNSNNNLIKKFNILDKLNSVIIFDSFINEEIYISEREILVLMLKDLKKYYVYNQDYNNKKLGQEQVLYSSILFISFLNLIKSHING